MLDICDIIILLGVLKKTRNQKSIEFIDALFVIYPRFFVRDYL